ncbi:MAG: endonuclease [Flavobacteriales bacterium]|nr:endonuclease [Flavobacteriales bacterium]
MDAKELGLLGENMAVDFLKKKGFDIQDRNWRFGKIEIDIIARLNGTTIIIEVKTRENSHAGEPWEFVTRKKQRRIITAAHEYVIQKELEGDTRFDIVSIVYNSKYQRVEHIEEAFFPML